MDSVRDIPGQPGYACDRDGSIWSMKSGYAKKMRTFPRGRQGHLGVNLTQQGKYRLYSVHRLIALAWIGNPPSSSHVVMHLDDDPQNNALSNLAYGLPRENSEQMVRRGRQARGERNANSKFTSAIVHDIRQQLASGARIANLARQHGVSEYAIYAIKTNRNWRQ